MEKGKFKTFLIKARDFFKQFPVIIASAIIVPVLLYTGRYMFLAEDFYNNLYYAGEILPCKGSEFKIKKIKPVLNLMNISSYSNYQGGYCYENYYAIAGNNFECVLIYNMNTQKVEHTIYTQQTNTSFHCNNIFFGCDFYHAYDKFPLLYFSQENALIPCTIACRIENRGGVDTITPIQTIYLELSEPLYYPNSYFDHSTGLLYYSGYTQNSYMRSSDNYLRYYSFLLPDYRVSTVSLTEDDALNTFKIPSETATQGGFISKGYLYQSFAGLSEAAAPFNKPGEFPKFMIIDLNEGSVVYKEEDLRAFGEGTAANEEFENVALAYNGKIYASGNTHLKLYEIEYIIESKSEQW